MTAVPPILLVDDDEKILFAFQQALRADGHTTVIAHDGEEALARIAERRPAMVFMDITMPKVDGLETLRRIKGDDPTLPVILITGFGTMETAITAMQLGAFEYLTKPLDLATGRDVARRAAATSAGEGTELVVADGVERRHQIVGASAAMQEVYKLIGSLSTTPNHTSVLILGESGTGKELVARAIHRHGPHADEPFIAINCTALPAELLESELFGHERGAFTGAVDRKRGKFEIAGKGTLFLDEIGNLSLPLQQKLLRVLQEREFERVGSNVPQRVEARFIAATNLDLAAEVQHKAFREDLYFRLNVVTVHLPPLRERREDIPLLAKFFLAKYNAHFGKRIVGFTDEAMAYLTGGAYPGNVRELENAVERAVMLTNGTVVLAQAVDATAHASPPTLPIISPVFSIAREHLLEQFENQFVRELLRAHGGNVTLAAAASQMTRQNLQRLMRKYDIRAEDYRA